MRAVVVLNIAVMLGGGFCSDLGLSSKNKRSSSPLKASTFMAIPQKTAVYEESTQKRRHASNKVPGHSMSDGMFSAAPNSYAPHPSGKNSVKSPRPLTFSKGKKPVSVGGHINALSTISGIKAGEPLPTNRQSPKDKKENISFSSSQKKPKNSKIRK